MKIAIVKLSALGDIVHAMVALQFIKAAIPNCHIDWVVEQRFAEVLADNPHVDHIITVNLKALKHDKFAVLREFCALKAQLNDCYDWVIDAQGLLKSAVIARLLSKHTAGFDKHSIREKIAAFFYRHHVNIAYDANTIDRNLAVLTQPLGVGVTSQQIIDKQPFLFYRSPDMALDSYFDVKQRNVLLVVGSTWPSRIYPKELLQQVIEGLPANYLIAWGNDSELETAEWLAQNSDAKVLRRLSLNDLKAAIDHCDLVIGNDTGPTHMAWGLNKPSITLFGPTPITRVYQTPINKVLKSPSAVNPFKLNKQDFSIREIPASAVVDLANILLSR